MGMHQTELYSRSRAALRKPLITSLTYWRFDWNRLDIRNTGRLPIAPDVAKRKGMNWVLEQFYSQFGRLAVGVFILIVKCNHTDS